MSLAKEEQKLSILDQLGISLSLLCAIHCVFSSILVMFLPMLARYYLTHPYFHIFLAIFIVPIGLFAFWQGYRRHHQKKIFGIGLFGLFVVGLLPSLNHSFTLRIDEPVWISIGSGFLIWAHWKNRQQCLSCSLHSSR